MQSKLANQLIGAVQTYMNKKEPYWPGRIIPENLRTDIESSLAHVFCQPYVLRSYILDCCYVIELEFQGFNALQGTKPIDHIHGTSLSLRRFYQKFGTYVHANEVHVDIGKYNAVIYVALNTYGLRQVMQKTRIQAKALHYHS